ncbi:DUF2482 family protein [Mammaliicoccus sciuri]|uniref:DUF2482 family protein n=1 Tax=Mammaliicoccus sciuri TaxID=1296 RepID=UPI0036ECCB54
MNLKEMTTEEIIELVGKKRSEIIELIESIHEQTDLDCYGTIIIGVEDKDKKVYAHGGGSGNIIDIAKLYNANDGLMSIANAAFIHKIVTGVNDEQ